MNASLFSIITGVLPGNAVLALVTLYSNSKNIAEEPFQHSNILALHDGFVAGSLLMAGTYHEASHNFSFSLKVDVISVTKQYYMCCKLGSCISSAEVAPTDTIC